MKTAQILITMLLLSSCVHKNTKEDTSKYSDQFVRDSFTYRGDYIWSFDLMGSEQVSKHIFYSDSISYSMNGKVYSTNYTMKKLSYDKIKGKWIGEDENGTVYVLFFKEKTKNALTIYKHKCKSTGLEESINFDLPAPDVTDDHGWNIYHLDKYKNKDILSLSGRFTNHEGEVFISDSVLTIDQKEVKKMSFHLGERRWVGKYQDEYLQVFFLNLNAKDSIQISTKWSNDLEKLYKTKYKSITDWNAYAKQ